MTVDQVLEEGWDFEKAIRAYENEDGESAWIEGHVDLFAACRTWRTHMVEMGSAADLDLDVYARHVYATMSPHDDDWLWFHTEPHSQSHPVTFLEIEGPRVDLPASPQESLTGAETDARANRLQAQLDEAQNRLAALEQVGDRMLAVVTEASRPNTAADLARASMASQWEQAKADWRSVWR